MLWKWWQLSKMSLVRQPIISIMAFISVLHNDYITACMYQVWRYQMERQKGYTLAKMPSNSCGWCMTLLDAQNMDLVFPIWISVNFCFVLSWLLYLPYYVLLSHYWMADIFVQNLSKYFVSKKGDRAVLYMLTSPCTELLSFPEPLSSPCTLLYLGGYIHTQ